jgi:hypothetical protein
LWSIHSRVWYGRLPPPCGGAPLSTTTVPHSPCSPPCPALLICFTPPAELVSEPTTSRSLSGWCFGRGIAAWNGASPISEVILLFRRSLFPPGGEGGIKIGNECCHIRWQMLAARREHITQTRRVARRSKHTWLCVSDVLISLSLRHRQTNGGMSVCSVTSACRVRVVLKLTTRVVRVYHMHFECRHSRYVIRISVVVPMYVMDDAYTPVSDQP